MTVKSTPGVLEADADADADDDDDADAALALMGVRGTVVQADENTVSLFVY